MPTFDRITLDPEVMGGKPCIRGLRVTVETVLGLLASGHTEEEILKAYPYLEKEDFPSAQAYAESLSPFGRLPGLLKHLAKDRPVTLVETNATVKQSAAERFKNSVK